MNKKGIMIFPRLKSIGGKIKADYVFLDKSNNGLPEKSPAFIPQGQFNLVDKDTKKWKLIKSTDNYFLYKRI